MTKRALSLLLTLVMVLSLCVPAFAAEDGFVAEAPADVIEEAPAAPVEPEAPEAEEPAEEPVVDEPVAEEADAPEIAAVMEEEDLPLLVALGVVSKEAHWALFNAVQKADNIMADVKAGKYHEEDFEFDNAFDLDALEAYIEDPVENDPFKDATDKFLAAYDEAVDFLAAVDGKEVDYDVTTDSVQTTAETLLNLLPDADASSADASVLTDAAGDDASSANLDQDTLKVLLGLAIATYDAPSVEHDGSHDHLGQERYRRHLEDGLSRRLPDRSAGRCRHGRQLPRRLRGL